MTKLQRVREAARNRLATERGQTELGFLVGSLAGGALGDKGKGLIPTEIVGLDSDLVIGGALFLLGRKTPGKRGAQMRGASFAFLAGGLRDLGASLASKF